MITYPTDEELFALASLEQLDELGDVADWEKIKYCLHHASPKQVKFRKAFFDRRCPDTGRKLSKFVALGGNRSGKSVVCGRLCFADYLMTCARNGDVFWTVSQNLDRSIGGVQKELWLALPADMFCGRIWDTRLGFGGNRTIVIKTSDGGTCSVEFRSSDQDLDTFEGAKLRGIWADERLPEAVYNRLLARLIDLDGFLLYSDIPEQMWQFERLKEAKPEANVYFQHFTMYDNAANLPPGAIEEAAAGMTQDEQRMRIAGEFGVMEGVVYREFIDRHKQLGGHLVTPFPIPAHWPKWRMYDYGGSAPTAVVWVAIAPNEHAYVYREYYQRDLSVEKNVQAVLAMSGDEVYRENLIDPHAFDPPPAYYGAADTIADQCTQAGLICTPWPYVQVMGERAMVQRVKFKLEHRTLWVFEHLIHLRREFRAWKYQLDKQTGKPKATDVYEHDNNHLLDGLKGFFGTNPMFTGGSVRVSGGEAA